MVMVMTAQWSFIRSKGNSNIKGNKECEITYSSLNKHISPFYGSGFGDVKKGTIMLIFEELSRKYIKMN